MNKKNNISNPKAKRSLEKHEYLDDSSLWDAITNNDVEALSYLYKQNYKGLFFYGIKSTNKVAIIEDCIQDVFLKLWNKRLSIKISLSIKPYLFQMFRHTLIDRLNKENQLAETKSLVNQLDISLSMEDLIIDQELKSENQKKLNLAIKGLSARSKEIIYLRFYAEFSYQQIAEMLDINYQSVRNAVYESIKGIRKAFAKS